MYFAARDEKERRNCFGAPSPSGSLISFCRSVGKRAAKFRPCTHQNKKISFARPKSVVSKRQASCLNATKRNYPVPASSPASFLTSSTVQRFLAFFFFFFFYFFFVARKGSRGYLSKTIVRHANEEYTRSLI